MKHNFKKATSVLLAALTALTICLQPAKIPARSVGSGISVCEDRGSEIDLSDNPSISEAH